MTIRHRYFNYSLFYTVMVIHFGNSALYEVIHGNKALAQTVLEAPEKGFYSLLELYPGLV